MSVAVAINKVQLDPDALSQESLSSPGRERLHLRPLQHRLHYAAEAPAVTVFPDFGDMPIKIFVIIQCRSLQRRVLPVAADDGEVVMLH